MYGNVNSLITRYNFRCGVISLHLCSQVNFNSLCSLLCPISTYLMKKGYAHVYIEKLIDKQRGERLSHWQYHYVARVFWALDKRLVLYLLWKAIFLTSINTETQLSPKESKTACPWAKHEWSWPGNTDSGCSEWRVPLGKTLGGFIHHRESHEWRICQSHWWGPQGGGWQQSGNSSVRVCRCYLMAFLAFGMVEAGMVCFQCI